MYQIELTVTRNQPFHRAVTLQEKRYKRQGNAQRVADNLAVVVKKNGVVTRELSARVVPARQPE